MSTIRRGMRPLRSLESATSSIAATASINAWPRSVAPHVGSRPSIRAERHRLPLRRVERGRLAEAEHRPGGPVEGEHGELLGRPAIGDDLPRRRPGPGPEVAAPQAGAGVDQDGRAPLAGPRRGSSGPASRRNGRANANASRQSAAARSSEQQDVVEPAAAGQAGRRRRRGRSSELNGTSPRGERRIRWKTIGAATASMPSR